ncbi:MAG: alpha-L-rhamnosidase N-terminal domain-containing protein [Planctomycetota bacterium]|nr:alpha-L-rhamnosidase N-terminal domain-containing protein [Planctomycetota bacterium]
MTGDMKYRLYVNGRLVSRGPVDIGMDFTGGCTRRWFYDSRDLTPFFRKGVNVIAVEVFAQWHLGFTVSRGKPGFLFEAELTAPGGEKTTVTSDGSWRGAPAGQFVDPVTWDMGKEPAGWREAGFDDKAWPACREIENLWEPLIPSEMPPLMEVRYPPLRIEGLSGRTMTADGSFTVVFDRVLSAYQTLKVKGGRGARVTLKALHTVTLTLDGGERHFELPFLTEVAPSFTVEVAGLTTPLEIVDVGANFTSQPLDYRGAFECSDEFLNRIWNVSRWAVQVCLQTHHLDSPNHQEPISDPGDYVIEAMANYYAFGQPWLARQDVRKFAWVLKDVKYHNFHTSYSLGWLQMLLDCYDFSGDRALVEEMAPYAHELLDTYATWRGKNGIISEAPNYMFMDWVTIGGFECHHPPAVIGQGYISAFYYNAMGLASRVAALMGDNSRVQAYAARRREIAEAFNRELWNEAKGLYRDGKPFQTSVAPYQWLPEDKDIETFSPHVNLLAVLYDLAPKERHKAIVERVLAAQEKLNTQPWFMYWVFQAIAHAGLFEPHGMAQMRRWEIVPETQSFREMWTGGDLSHGWCSSPLVQMSARILGVTPAAPGFRTIAIRPMLCGLTWARGTVPTPQGDVAVAWSLHEGRLLLDVTVPADADVVVPTAGFPLATVTLNGQKAAPAVHVPAGTHRIEVVGQR